MVNCAVYNCNSNNKKQKSGGDGNQSSEVEPVKFFRFPQNADLSKIWKQKCGRKDKFILKNNRICSKHFLPEHYAQSLRHRLLNYSPSNSKKLNLDAIPTENLPNRRWRIGKNNEYTSVLQRRERKEKRDLKDVVKETISETNELAGEPVLLRSEQLDLALIIEDEDNACNKVDKGTNTNALIDVELINLRLANKKLMKDCHFLRTENECIKNIFTPVQIKKMTYQGKRIRWHANDIAQAISIYASGPKAYRLLLKKKYPLPAVSTLKKWAQKIDIAPGFLNIVFVLMKNADLTPYQKVCVIMADEMKIQKSYEYDQTNDILYAPANYVQVIMARGLMDNWKQPIFYSYDAKLTKIMIERAIQKLHEIGYNVVAVVTDMGGGNRGLWASMGVCETQPFFMNPCNKNKSVYVFSDAPHLIKLLRNHFLDSGILANGKLLTKEPILELLENQSVLDLKIASRLTPLHISCKYGKRQKVKYATQLFSHTISRALARVGALGISKSPNWNELSVLCKNVNDWFDVFNSRVARIDSRPRMAAYGLEIEQQQTILDNMSELIKEMRVGTHKSLIPFQKGILMSINALKLIFDDLKDNYHIKYLLTYRLNQDPLELFFGVMRAKGGLYDHPSCLQFKYRLRSFILGKNESIISEHGNIEIDKSAERKMPINEQLFKKNKSDEAMTASESEYYDSLVDEMFDIDEGFEGTEKFKIITSDMLTDLAHEVTTSMPIIEEINDLKYDGLEHLAGYIIYRLKDKVANMIHNYCDTDSTSTYTWTDTLSEGFLRKPNLKFMELLQQLDDIYNVENGKTLQPGNNYIKNLIAESNGVDLPYPVKNLFYRCKMFFKIRTMNLKLIEDANSKKRKIKKTIT